MASLRRVLRFLSALLLFLTVWFLWPREVGGFNAARSGGNSVPDYAMVNAHYISVKKGLLEMETRAQDASFDINTHRMNARNIVALLYNTNKERTVLTADRASFFMEEHRLHVAGNVQSLSPDGFLLRTSEATYLQNKSLITAPEPVQGETLAQELQVWGDRAEAPLNEKRLYLHGNARAQYTTREQKHGSTHIRGDSAVLDREEGKATFLKNVEARQEDFTGTGEQGEVFYSQDDRSMKYLALSRDVKIMQKDGRYTRSQVAEFFAPSDTVVLSGFPAVYNGDDAVTGDKITMYRATGVVEVTATNAAASQQRNEPGKASAPRPLTKEDEELIP